MTDEMYSDSPIFPGYTLTSVDSCCRDEFSRLHQVDLENFVGDYSTGLSCPRIPGPLVAAMEGRNCRGWVEKTWVGRLKDGGR